MEKTSTSEIAKKALGAAAADLIQEGMLVGLGTGTTATFFIQSLIERCRSGLKITAVATSKKSMEQARAGGIPFADVDAVSSVDLTIDGADEIDPKKRMIKGGGGALIREKILASISNEMVVIVDQSKLVEHLGKFPLPVELIPFARKALLLKLQNLGYDGKLRTKPDGNLYQTDNGNLIFDIHSMQQWVFPEKDHDIIRSIPGVVDTGFFFDLAGRVLVGYPNGNVEIRP